MRITEIIVESLSPEAQEFLDAYEKKKNMWPEPNPENRFNWGIIDKRCNGYMAFPENKTKEEVIVYRNKLAKDFDIEPRYLRIEKM